MSSDGLGEEAGEPSAELQREPAIHFDGVSKCYQIYERPQDRLKQSISAHLRGWIRATQRSYYREFWALKNVSFSVRKGETVGIIGRNGSGKSTLLQILCGTSSPTAGQVRVEGRIGALLELGSGFNPEFTGRENVYLNGAVLGLTRQQVDERFDAIVSFADIGDFLDQPVKQYSSGMYVRLAFAVIAHADADILVIDEALSVGDVFFGQKCMRFLREFMQKGTVIFVSHDTSAILNLCDRVIWLQAGEIVQEGPAKDITALYLENLYYEDAADISGSAVQADSIPDCVGESPRDMRQDLINSSTLRNDIEVFDFSDASRAFGTGMATILRAGFFDKDSKPLAWMVGGEDVRLSIWCRAEMALERPVVGFEIYDRLGQTIFADNTYLAMRGSPHGVPAGHVLGTHFEFRMPVMRQGDYTVSVAIAEGTQENHVQHHWLHDALAFRVHARTICLGLMGVPMQLVRMEVLSSSESPSASPAINRTGGQTE